jgi:DNA-binding transcriptional LysR family regulator
MHQIDISRVDLNLLVVFEALMEERQVARAAKRMNLSQSATSHALGRLRRLFDDPLFVRHSTGIEPTPRARVLEGPLREALAQVRRVVSPAAAFDPAVLVRSYTVATHDYPVVVLLTKLMAQLRHEAPMVDLKCVSVSYDDVIAGLDRGTVHMACGAFLGLDVQRIQRTPLFEDQLVGVVRSGHPALKDGRMDENAFIAFPHVLTSPDGASHSPLDVGLSARGLSRRVAMSVPNALSVPSIVATSDLIGVLPKRLAATLAGGNGIVAFELPIATETVSCDLLMLGALANVAEARWIQNIFQRVAAERL